LIIEIFGAKNDRDATMNVSVIFEGEEEGGETTTHDLGLVLPRSDVKERLKALERKVQSLAREEYVATVIAPTYNVENPGENYDPNTSFHLGVALFGSDISQAEEAIREKLTDVEHEVEQILEMGAARHDEPPASSTTTSTQSLEQVQHDSQLLKLHLQFLKCCSRARALLDESITNSTPSLARSISIDNNSPSSTAPNHEEDGTDLETASRQLVEAYQALDEARVLLTTDAPWQALGSEAAREQRQTAFCTLDSIQTACRRHKVNLIAQARQLWHAAVQLEEGTCSVWTGSGSSAASPLAVAYNVLTIFADASDPRDNQDGTTVLDLLFRQFVRKLHTTTFQPALDRIQRHQAQRLAPTIGIPYVINENATVATKLSSSFGPTATRKGPVRVLEWRRDGNSVDPDAQLASTDANQAHPPTFIFPMAAWQDTLQLLQRILTFVTEHVLLDRPELCRRVGNRLFAKPPLPPLMGNANNRLVFNLDLLGLDSLRLGDDYGLLMEPLMVTLRSTAIPKYLPPVVAIRRIEETTTNLQAVVLPFVEQMREKKLMLPEHSRLDQLTQEVAKEYIDGRRSTILIQARDLLVTNDYHNTSLVGDTIPPRNDLGLDDGLAVFKLHAASVSDTATQLMQLCRRAMDESVAAAQALSEDDDDTLAALPLQLYRAAREILDLYRAMIPVRHGYEIATLPRTAAILHNDAVFLAHYCLTLGVDYREKYPVGSSSAVVEQLRQNCIFVDLVPLFRDLADRAMGDMLNLQARQLHELVGERISLLGQALRSSEILTEWVDAETALDAGLYHLRHLHQTWNKVLAQEILHRSLSFLSDVLCDLYLKQVTQAVDISVTASSFVSSLFYKAADEIKVLLDQDTSASSSWDQFQAIGRFMDMSLADIKVALGDGLFRSVTGPDLTRLIKATFDDSPQRREILKLIAAF
jgi:Centromere/kinetochore Zw10